MPRDAVAAARLRTDVETLMATLSDVAVAVRADEYDTFYARSELLEQLAAVESYIEHVREEVAAATVRARLGTREESPDGP